MTDDEKNFDARTAEGVERGKAYLDHLIAGAHSWVGFPPERAAAWCRYFFNFYPVWPGASFMNYAYHAYKQGKPPGMVGWAQFALDAESVGFTPDSFYTLKLCLRVESKERYPRHPGNFGFPDRHGRMHVSLDLREWSMWVQLLDAGTTPLEATRWMLSGGTRQPRGALIDLSSGSIVSTDDAG